MYKNSKPTGRLNGRGQPNNKQAKSKQRVADHGEVFTAQSEVEAIGDEAVLIGSQADQSITADDMASRADTISYEILLSISDRVPRLYI